MGSNNRAVVDGEYGDRIGGPEPDPRNIMQARHGEADNPSAPSSRILSFDYLRAIVILLLLLHHGGIYRYSIAGVPFEEFEPLIEAFLLGGFVFLSGYLAVESFDGAAGGRSGKFLRARFWRIYPPYLVALVLFGTVVGVTLDATDWLAHVLGLQLLLVPAVDKVAKTVWFIGMIWLFFVLVAGMLAICRRPVGLLAAFAAVYAGAWFVHLRWGWMDARLLYFFPVFSLAVWIARGRWLPKILLTRFFHLEKVALAALAAAVMMVFPQTSRFGTDDPLAVAAFTFFVMAAGLLALAVLQPVAERRIGFRWVSLISVASFFIYLLHRPIWIAVLAVFPQGNPDREFLVRMLVATPIVIGVAYVLQLGYTRLLDHWQDGRRKRAASPRPSGDGS